jgi:hypothetical protein
MSSAAVMDSTFKPFVFIGSSSSELAKNAADRLSNLLRPFSEPKPWWNDVFLPGHLTLEALWKAVQEHDFGIFLFTPEAAAEIREKKVQIGNLNVLFEFGLFLGQLGPERVLLLVPSKSDVHIPNDLDALTQIRYDPNNLEDAVRQIEGHFKRFLERSALSGLDAFNTSEARRHRSAQFREQPRIRIGSLSREVKIKSNGDAEIEDTFNSLTATGHPVDQLPLQIRSSAGRPADPIFRLLTPLGGSQAITWIWNKDATRSPVYSGMAAFRPSIRQNQPLGFTRSYLVHNAFVWTAEDRLITTGYKQTSEREFVELTSVVEQLEIRVIFPEDRFPDHFAITAGRGLADSYVEDLFESERSNHGFKKDQQARTAILKLRLPLSGYRYEIRWPLPKVDNKIPEFSHRLSGLVEEVNRRLLAKADLSVDSYRELQNSLLQLRGNLTIQLGASDEQYNCALFIYDRKAGGLRCAGSILNGEPHQGIMDVLFRPGQGLAGRVFRSRYSLGYRNISGLEKLNVHICEPVDGELPTGSILCLPLFLPEEPARCVGVLSIDDPQGTTRLTHNVQDAALQTLLKQIACEWYLTYFNKVAAEPSSAYWNARPKGIGGGRKTIGNKSRHLSAGK